MKTGTSAVVALFFVLLAQNALACDKPTAISIPDGSSATTEEMDAAGKTYHEYMVAMQNYQVCLQNEAERSRVDSSNVNKTELEQLENRYAALHNAASSEMKQATRDFDATVQAYKSRQ